MKRGSHYWTLFSFVKKPFFPCSVSHRKSKSYFIWKSFISKKKNFCNLLHHSCLKLVIMWWRYSFTPCSTWLESNLTMSPLTRKNSLLKIHLFPVYPRSTQWLRIISVLWFFNVSWPEIFTTNPVSQTIEL